jgi:LuxR family maltose regulon positive regulatory protein
MGQFQAQRQADANPLLHTKLAAPVRSIGSGSSLVSRPALLDRLDEALSYKLTLLSAPAGYGKTTLINAWIQQIQARNEEQARAEDTSRQPATAWVLLDAGDNDPVRFWRYVITACQTFRVDLGEAALALLFSAPQPPLEALLTNFINELAQLPHPCVLVLEDYHLITTPLIHETLSLLLDYLPPTLHLILTTRQDPPLPLARMRARNDLNEFNTEDLRFSLAETQAFLQLALPFSLPPEIVAQLDARIEGWAAGLRLVALALQGRHDFPAIEHFLATFSGSHRRIVEFLAADVLAAQPEQVQQFLLQTAFLHRLTASLCNAVTGRQDSGLVLDQLVDANLFLVPVEGAGGWYRYHTLFAEAMDHTAKLRFGETAMRMLADKASRWYEAQGLLSQAVETALAAQTFDRVAVLIERFIAPRLVNNEYLTLRRWLEQLPNEVVRTHPVLCFTHALAIQFTSDRRALETMRLMEAPLQMADDRWQAENNQRQLGAVQTVRALAFWWQGDLTQTFRAAATALMLLPEDETQWRSVSLIFVASEEMLAGQLDRARQTILTARALCEAVGNIYGFLSATNILADICARQGELQQAASYYRQVIAGTENVPIHQDQAANDQVLFDRARACNGLAALYLEWNNLAAAEQAADQAREIGHEIGEEYVYAPATVILARVRHAQGEMAQAQQLLHTLIAQTPQRRWPLLMREAQAEQARLAMAAGDFVAVQRWSAALDRANAELMLLQQEAEALIQARLLIAQGDIESAHHLLTKWQAAAQSGGRRHSELEIQVLTALAHFVQDNLPQAIAMLTAAFTVAQPEGYQRIFRNEGAPTGAMLALLRAVFPLIKEEPLALYVRDLLLAVSEEQGAAGATSQSTAPFLIEPLSAQEQRVLRLLAAGLSNPEIARELIVSVNTIKTQVQSIFRKLNVNSREEAGDMARRLNLR